jgi:hypothetical protein
MGQFAVLSTLLVASATAISAAHARVPDAELVPAAVGQAVAHFANAYEIRSFEGECPNLGLFFFSYVQQATVLMADGSQPIAGPVHTETVFSPRRHHEVLVILECEGFRLFDTGVGRFAVENTAQSDPNDAFRFRTVE